MAENAPLPAHEPKHATLGEPAAAEFGIASHDREQHSAVPGLLELVESGFVQGSVTQEAIAGMLHDAGYRANAEMLRSGKPALRSASCGVRFSIFFEEPTETVGRVEPRVQRFNTLEFHCGLKMADRPSLELVNSWNRNARRGVAFLDKDGDIGFKLSVDATGGITSDRLRNALDRWDQTLGQFLRHIEW